MSAPRLLVSSKTARAGAGASEVTGRTLFSRLLTAVWCGSFMACGPAGVLSRGVAHEGFAVFEVALPVLADKSCFDERGGV
jgi:hypothetical protein